MITLTERMQVRSVRAVAMARLWRVCDLQLARKMIGHTENIEVPPFAEVLLGENLPAIASILRDLVDRIAVSGNGPV